MSDERSSGAGGVERGLDRRGMAEVGRNLPQNRKRIFKARNLVFTYIIVLSKFSLYSIHVIFVCNQLYLKFNDGRYWVT